MSRRPHRARAVAIAATALVVLALSGCGDSDDGGAGAAEPGGVTITATPTPSSAAPEGTVVRVKVTADEVDPAGERVEVGRGEPLVLLIDAEEPGEMHVHSSPEQMISYQAGFSTVTLTFDRPGVVEIESHTLDKLIVQVEVR